MMKPFTRADLISKFSESLGKEKAASMIDEVLAEAKLTGKSLYEKDDVLEIVKFLKPKGGLITILATCLAVEAYRISGKAD